VPLPTRKEITEQDSDTLPKNRGKRTATTGLLKWAPRTTGSGRGPRSHPELPSGKPSRREGFSFAWPAGLPRSSYQERGVHDADWDEVKSFDADPTSGGGGYRCCEGPLGETRAPLTAIHKHGSASEGWGVIVHAKRKATGGLWRAGQIALGVEARRIPWVPVSVILWFGVHKGISRTNRAGPPEFAT